MVITSESLDSGLDQMKTILKKLMIQLLRKKNLGFEYEEIVYNI